MARKQTSKTDISAARSSLQDVDSCLLPGEGDAISVVIYLGKQFGYGNMIAHLRREWAESLVAQGIPEKWAIKGAFVSPYPLRQKTALVGDEPLNPDSVALHRLARVRALLME